MLPPDSEQRQQQANFADDIRSNEYMAGMGDPFLTAVCDPSGCMSLETQTSMSIEPSLIQPNLFKSQDVFLEQFPFMYPPASSLQDRKEINKRSRSARSRRFSAPDSSRQSSFSPESVNDSPTPSNSTATNEISRRDAHMASEQRRRAVMNDSFERLRQLLPPSEYRKPSKANILQATVGYIESLQRSVRNLVHKTQFLARENAILSQNMNGLTLTPMGIAMEAAMSIDGKLPLAPRNPNVVAIAPMPDKDQQEGI